MTTPSSRSLAVLCALVAGVAGLSRPPAQAQEVTTSDLETAAGDTSSWLMYRRDYHGHRFVELDEITPENVDRLHPAWVFATGGENRGREATPLVHDGVIYLSADESRVFAIDARTGEKKWGFEPEMSDAVERVYCCGSNNRGVALFGELVYVGTMDARLIALHRETGAVAWETVVVDWQQGYSITGAPLVVDGLVLTGELRWTTYTIPGPGEPGNDCRLRLLDAGLNTTATGLAGRRDHCGPGRGRQARMRKAPSDCRDPRGRGGSAPGDEGAAWLCSLSCRPEPADRPAEPDRLR